MAKAHPWRSRYGLTWAAAWFGFGAILWPFFGPTVVEVALGFAVMGVIGGAIFSLALGIAEGRRRLDEMSLPSFAVLGRGHHLGG